MYIYMYILHWSLLNWNSMHLTPAGLHLVAFPINSFFFFFFFGLKEKEPHMWFLSTAVYILYIPVSLRVNPESSFSENFILYNNYILKYNLYYFLNKNFHDQSPRKWDMYQPVQLKMMNMYVLCWALFNCLDTYNTNFNGN